MSNTKITTAQLRELLFATENGGREDVLKVFSWAGNAKSSYSFGVLQFDVASDHGGVQEFLLSHGFSSNQVSDLARLGGGLTKQELDPLNKQLQAIPKEDLNAFTERNLEDAIDRIDSLITRLKSNNPSIGNAIAESGEIQLALADYDNQFNMGGIGGRTRPNTMLAYLEGQVVSMPGGTLQLGENIARSDVQDFINATHYGQSNPRSVAGREARLEGALTALDAHIAVPADSRRHSQLPILGQGSLRSGATGDQVGALQDQLRDLGYTNTRGAAIVSDGIFGADTESAVINFQRDHHLNPDGIAGPKTRKALQEDIQSLAPATPDSYAWRYPPHLDDPNHPDNNFYIRIGSLKRVDH